MHELLVLDNISEHVDDMNELVVEVSEQADKVLKGGIDSRCKKIIKFFTGDERDEETRCN